MGVTEEQAMYAKGFEEALEHLRQSEPPGSNDLAAANTLATLSTASVAGRSIEVHRSLPEPHRSLDVHKSLLEAPQNPGIPLSVQASSHSRPASAASGSYDSETYQVPDGVKRKVERISQLDDRVAGLKNENADLAAVVKKMKAGVALLKQEVIEHVNSGCDIRVAEGANF